MTEREEAEAFRKLCWYFRDMTWDDVPAFLRTAVDEIYSDNERPKYINEDDFTKAVQRLA